MNITRVSCVTCVDTSPPPLLKYFGDEKRQTFFTPMIRGVKCCAFKWTLNRTWIGKLGRWDLHPSQKLQSDLISIISLTQDTITLQLQSSSGNVSDHSLHSPLPFHQLPGTRRQLTSWSRPPSKVNSSSRSQKKFFTFYETRRFVSMFKQTCEF